jgi:hypothetical protein
LPLGLCSLSGTIYSITGSSTSLHAVPKNLDRYGLEFYNGLAGVAYVCYGSLASATQLTFKLAPSASFSDDRARPYLGPVTVITEGTPAGRLLITELSSPSP